MSHFGGVLGFFHVNEFVARAPSGWRPVVVVRLSPSKMRAESKGVRAGSEAMHSDTRARKQATSTVPLSERSNRAMNRVPGGQSRAALSRSARREEHVSSSQSTVRHVYKSNYEIKDVRAAWKAMKNSHTYGAQTINSNKNHTRACRGRHLF